MIFIVKFTIIPKITGKIETESLNFRKSQFYSLKILAENLDYCAGTQRDIALERKGL